jgi:hypothetical protein
MFRFIDASIIITKPADPEHPVARPILLFYDYAHQTIEIRIQGNHPLRGTSFGIRHKDIVEVLTGGQIGEELPPLPPPE